MVNSLQHDTKFGEIIKRWRIKREWSVRELARRSTVDKQSILRIESGATVPDWCRAWLLIAALGIPPDQVIPPVPSGIDTPSQ